MDVIYTDFAKAFDRVNHSLLVQKLRTFGFSFSLLKFISSYLTDRWQFVSYKHVLSWSYKATSGVPQGSNLGPLLFILFVNDVADCIKYSSILLYADDLKLYKPVSTLEDTLKLQSDLDNLLSWSKDNKLYFNISKCSQMSYTLKLDFINTVYTMDGINLRIVTEMRDLGVYFTPSLHFGCHIHRVCSSALRVMGFVLRNTAGFTSIKTLILLYNSLVRSKLEYACVVWAPASYILQHQIETVQNKFLKFLYYRQHGVRPPFSSYQHIRNFFHVQTLQQRRNLQSLIFVFKILNNLICCPPLQSELTFKIPSRVTRTCAFLQQPFCRTDIRANSPIPSMIRSYNRACGLFNFDVHGISLDRFKSSLLALSSDVWGNCDR